MNRPVVWLLVGHVLAVDPESIAARARFSRLDPAAKLAAAAAIAVAVAFVTDRILAYFALAFSVGALLASGLDLRFALKRLVPVAGFALVTSASVGVIRGAGAFELLFVRILAATVFLLAMALTTTPVGLAGALRRLRVPAVITNTLLLTYRYLFLFEEEATRMRRAREARGFRTRGSLRSRDVFRTLASTAGMVLIRAHRRSQAVHRAMLARHFTGDLPTGRARPLGAADAALLGCALVISAILLGATAGGIPWLR